jgi:hypothetical protein
MKPGDIVVVYADAEKCKYPIGQATLIKKEKESFDLEMWVVEYLDYPEKHFKVFLHKPDVPIIEENDKHERQSERSGLLP